MSHSTSWYNNQYKRFHKGKNWYRNHIRWLRFMWKYDLTYDERDMMNDFKCFCKDNVSIIEGR